MFVQMFKHGHVSRCAAERAEDYQKRYILYISINFNPLVLRSDETLIAYFLAVFKLIQACRKCGTAVKASSSRAEQRKSHVENQAARRIGCSNPSRR